MSFGNMAVNYPYQRIVAISASDTVSIASGPADAILCLTAGNCVIIDGVGSSAITVPMIAGQLLPLRVVRVNSTSTTGTYAALYFRP